MNLQELLEKDRERLTASLLQAGTAERAVPVMESEYDRLLYQYNELCSDDYERRCAAMMLQTARMTVPMLDCIGETKIWEQGGKLLSEEKKKPRMSAVVLLIAGILLSAAALLVIAGTDQTLNKLFETPAAGAAFIGGLACLFFAGFFFTSKKAASYSEKQLKAENRIDPQKIYQSMHAVMIVIDRNIRESVSARQMEEQQGIEKDPAQDKNDLSLYGDLLEAARSKDGTYALDQLSKLPFYLHQKGIDTLEYSDDNRSWFDAIPGERSETIRPALVKDGKLLKKGIVSGDWQ